MDALPVRLHNAWRKKTWWELDKNTLFCFEEILEATPYHTASLRPLTSHLKTTREKQLLDEWEPILVLYIDAIEFSNQYDR